MECKQCGNEFEAKRSTASFCGGACRLAYHRGEVSVTEDKAKLSVTRPPCTPDQLTSSCLTRTDKPTCEYLRNQTTAKPGDKDYAGVCSQDGEGCTYTFHDVPSQLSKVGGAS